MSARIAFFDMGIASILKSYSLVVPVNQRPYSWEKEHVDDLFSDLERAIEENESEYFLGTMVGIRVDEQDEKKLEVADGQQRLATTMILIAAIRDYLVTLEGEDALINHLEQSFLRSYDMDTGSYRPNLTLNVGDNEAYVRAVIENPRSTRRGNFDSNSSASICLLRDTAEHAKARVAKIADTPRPENRVKRLKKWVGYLENAAKMILVVVPDAGKAFTIFETLNDRGLKLSQVHLIKNYLYGRAQSGERMREAQSHWDAMYGALEAVDEDGIFIDYIRHLWITYYGYTKAEHLFDGVRERLKRADDVVEFASQLADNVTPYTAMLNPAHSYWGGSFAVRQSIAILRNELNVSRLRPLMLAIASKWNTSHELERGLRLCVAWSVRFLVVGGIGSGSTEQFYATTSKKVRDGEIADAEMLAAAMRKEAPDDDQFREAFSRTTVSRGPMARYFLRALEATYDGRRPADAMLVAEQNPEEFDLEHVLPSKPADEWAVTPDEAKRLVKRLGNMALLEKKINSKIKSAGPLVKLPEIARSSRSLSKVIGASPTWSASEINARQAMLSDLAVKTWVMKV